MPDYIQVITTTNKRADAGRITTALVEKRLAACVQIIGPITSTYWWKGKMETAREWLCLIKSRQDLYPQLEKAIKEMHPYETPEITAVPIIAGDKNYLDWLSSETQGKSRSV